MNNSNLPDAFPDFLVIGASKCGTSSLYAYLKQHPDICLSHIKEMQYFSREEIYKLGPDGLCKKYLPEYNSQARVGDISPSYMTQAENVIPRILETYGTGHLPDIIVMMRNPVSRAISHYSHMVRSGYETLSLADALKHESARLASEPAGWWGYLTEGHYAVQLQPWLNVFPKEKIHFMITERLDHSLSTELKKVFRFLQIDPEVQIDNKERKNTGGGVRSQAFSKLLGKQSVTKSLLKSILPYRVRQKLRTRLVLANTTDEKMHISEEDIQFIQGQFPETDKLLLEQIVQDVITEWQIKNDS